MTALLWVVVFASTSAIYLAAVAATDAIGSRRYRAAVWEFAAWIAGAVAWVLVVRVSLWLLVPEGAGVLAGSIAGVWLLRRRA